jgi:AbrB family transcriptional regulator (stage V sporulation protein T)
MKATGIVRRIDELGRVVVPKEIRSTLRLKSGDALEIYTQSDDIILKKYSPIASIEKFSMCAAKSLADVSGMLCAVCDTFEVLHAYGSGKKDIDGRAISKRLDEVIRKRKCYMANLCEGGDILPICEGEQASVTAQIVVPIVCGGDCLGGVVLSSTQKNARMDAHLMGLAQLTANILANQFE